MSTATKMRLLVVHADAGFRQGLVRGLGLNPWIDVVGAAMSGRTALPKVVSYRPDVVVVDLDQNEAEGLDLLQYLERSHPGILRLAITSPAVQESSASAVARMNDVDVVSRSAGGPDDAALARLVQDVVAPLLRRTSSRGGPGGDPPLRPVPAPDVEIAARPSVSAPAPAPLPAAAAAAVAVGPPPSPLPPRPSHQVASLGARAPHVLGIGVSTGGPKALAVFLPMLPADFPLPIVVVQHMPPKFTKSLAESLDKNCRLRVREAQNNDKLERGTILIAPGGFHLRVLGSDGAATVRITEDPPECSCRPSVDYLFRSLVEVYGARTMGVVLTGMGEDGWIGSRLIRSAGGSVLAQDEATSTVFGMPRGPIEAGIARAVPLERMAESVVAVVKGVPCS
ncbi:MAG: hypothetical protein JNN13_06340 [Planctomycetes bacterium]|nr:hypothetical protein [Planctomycetota bacterium]